MASHGPTRLPDVPDIPASIIASGISDAPLTSLVEVACGGSSPRHIDRMNVGFRILHPLFDGIASPGRANLGRPGDLRGSRR